MAKPAKKTPTGKFKTADVREMQRLKEVTQMEGDADRSDGRKTRVQQRGRIRR